MRKHVLSILPFIVLNACATKQQEIAPVTTQIQSQLSQPVTPAPAPAPAAPAPAAPAPKPVEVVTEEQKQDVENVTWKLPDWCEDLEQNFNQVQVCGVALHKNLQMSRTRSEMDARKQLARRTGGQVDEIITEKIIGSDSEVNSESTLRSEAKVGPYIIENQKTIQSEGKYLTFTKVVQYFN